MGRNRQCQDGTCLEISGELQLVLQDRHAMALEVDHVKEAIDHREDQTTRPGTPRALEDQPGRTRDDGRTKRRTTETSGSRGSREPISLIEELRAQCQSLQEKVIQMELYAASRDQLIKDTEVKFTDYLRTHNQNVHNEFNTLNQRLT